MLLDFQILGFFDWTDIDKTKPHFTPVPPLKGVFLPYPTFSYTFLL